MLLTISKINIPIGKQKHTKLSQNSYTLFWLNYNQMVKWRQRGTFSLHSPRATWWTMHLFLQSFVILMNQPRIMKKEVFHRCYQPKHQSIDKLWWKKFQITYLNKHIWTIHCKIVFDTLRQKCNLFSFNPQNGSYSLIF
jgi:hypothetical protein